MGMIVNCFAMVVATALTKVTPEEKAAREALFVVPVEERDPKKIKKTLKVVKLMIVVGVAITLFLIIFWALPYMNAIE